MSYSKTSDELGEILEELSRDLVKALRGNKTAAQRVRTGTVLLAKVAKEWRQLSLEEEKRALKKRTTAKKKSSSRKKS